MANTKTIPSKISFGIENEEQIDQIMNSYSDEDFIQYVGLDEYGMMVWDVQLIPNPNLHGDFGVTLLALNTVYEYTSEYSFVLSVESVNDTPVIESFSDGLAIEFDEDTIFETTLQVTDLDNLNDVTLQVSVQTPFSKTLQILPDSCLRSQ